MKNLRKIRESKGYSQKEFAAICELATSRYNQYETGNRQPDLQTIEMIADKLDVSIDELFGRPERKILPFSPYSAHEQRLVLAYRNKPELHHAVDILLELDEDEAITVYQAADSEANTPDAYVQIEKSRWEHLNRVPPTDQDLL